MNIIKKRLLELGQAKAANPEKYRVHFSQNREAHNFINDIQNYPHAYVLACLMDRQIKAEKAWEIPYKIKLFLGTFEIDDLFRYSEDFYTKLFETHKLHRLTSKMGKIFFHGVSRINAGYAGDASKIWRGKPSSAAVVYRFLQFSGCGIKIATMAANILVRQYGIELADKASIDISPDVHVRRALQRLGLVPEIKLANGKSDLDKINELIIYTAREICPEYPGIIDYSLWDIGRKICHPQSPECGMCDLGDICPKLLDTQ